MFLVLEDDDRVHVYEHLAAVVGDVEPLDAEALLCAVYDDAGMRYAIRWIRPNGRHGRSGTNGVDELVPVAADPVALREMLRAASAVFPASAEPAVRALAR